MKRARTVIGLCYNSTTSSQDSKDALNSEIRFACHRYNDIIICGDFNYPSIDWNLMQAESEGQNFLDTVMDCFLIQHVREPTRGQNILDLVMSKEGITIENVETCMPLGSSDHDVVKFDLKTEVEEEIWKYEYYDYRNGNYKELAKYMKEQNWEELFMNTDANEMWEIFKEIPLGGISRYVPKKRRKGRKKRPLWFNRAVKSSIKKKQLYWRRYRESNEYQDYLRYKRALKKATRAVRKAKRKLEKKIAKNIKNDPKAFFKYSRSKLKSRETIGPLTNEYGETISDGHQVSNMLNDYFSSVFTEETLNNMPDPRLLFEGDAGDFVNEVDLSNRAVSEKLMKLNPEKSPGVDHIYPVVLKRLALVISVPLSVISCESFVIGIVPKEWKLANVTAIFKKGLKNQVGNYRPVRLTSQVCKVMEMLVRDTITEHLKKYKLIKDSQFGFTKGRSCLSNLLKFLEEVTRYVEEGYPVDVIYLDFSKAFDRVPHQ